MNGLRSNDQRLIVKHAELLGISPHSSYVRAVNRYVPFAKPIGFHFTVR